MYSSTLSLTSTLRWGGWLTPRPGRFAPRERDPIHIYRRLDAPQGQFYRLRKTSPLPGIDLRTIQAVASHCADFAMPALSQ